ncbi:hypothetical protein Q4I32_005006 [Leishmania shawi]|uniref:Uncharacterized protein n=1 Tax=Leishmania shawi TaxID=5680 RepID=A0AAW3BNT8_9TRYP
MDLEVVNVGDGRRATLVEHLLARLEQHGLRRRLAAEDDATSYAVDVAARGDTGESAEDGNDEVNTSGENGTDGSRAAPSCSSSVGDFSPVAQSKASQTREAYYYLCVPCELRLTRISRRPPPWRALEDVHFHFSSATHRATASWMADDDIDETLHSTPLVTPTDYYSRIYVNGIPTLLSRRPGGGDMFYPLPHEQELVASLNASAACDYDGVDERHGSRTKSQSSTVSVTHTGGLFPPSAPRGAQGGAPVLWHRALLSLYTKMVQVVRRTRSSSLADVSSDRRKYRVDRTRSRIMVGVDHVSLGEYREQSWLPLYKVPLSLAVYRLRRERVPKPLLARPEYTGRQGQAVPLQCSEAAVLAAQAADVAHRSVYTQPYQPISEGSRDDHRQSDAFSMSIPVPTTVFEDECYRVALLSAVERAHHEDLLHTETSRRLSRSVCVANGEPQEMHHPVLTLELLMQHTQSTSQPWGPAVGSNTALRSTFVSTTAPPMLSHRSSIGHLTRRSSPSSTSSAPVSEDPTTSSSSIHTRKRAKREGCR